MWLNNPQCGNKEGGKFPFFWQDNHQGKSSHIYIFVFFFQNAYFNGIGAFIRMGQEIWGIPYAGFFQFFFTLVTSSLPVQFPPKTCREEAVILQRYS